MYSSDTLKNIDVIPSMLFYSCLDLILRMTCEIIYRVCDESIGVPQIPALALCSCQRQLVSPCHAAEDHGS